VNTRIRGYKPEDHNLIASTFLKGAYYGNNYFSMINKNVFMANYKHVLEALLTQSAIRVACLPDDEDTVLGYSLLTKDLTAVHWVFIKKDWRHRFGVFQMLLPSMLTSYSHFSTQGLEIAKKKFPNLTFNPFKLT